MKTKIDYQTIPTTGVDLVDPIHEVQYTVMSSAFPWPCFYGSKQYSLKVIQIT